jgi:aminomethyltransferase
MPGLVDIHFHGAVGHDFCDADETGLQAIADFEASKGVLAIDTTTTPPEAALNWAIQKVRRTGGARAGGFPGADKVLAQIDNPATLARKRVGLVALERVPVREHTELQSTDGQKIGEVTSGLLGPTVNEPIAIGYVTPAFAAVGTRVNAMVRGKAVPMEVRAMPFVPANYYRG